MKVAWSANMYRRSEEIETRLQRLVRLIREGKYSTPKLARALKVSEPTISRSLAALRERGYSIRAVNDGGKWSYELATEPGTPNGKKGGAQ
jgi:biotin operon repressor